MTWFFYLIKCSAIQSDSPETTTLQSLLWEIVVDAVPERRLLSFMVISKEAISEDVLECITMESIMLWFLTHQQ